MLKDRKWMSGLLLLICMTACFPVTARASTTEQEIADAIDHLGDSNFDRREQASRTLWSAGKAAEPALRQALKSDDPEVAQRARSILDKFEFGLLPDTPPDIFALLEQYRSGNPQVKMAALDGLASRGTRGSRVLLGLRREERDEGIRAAILKALSSHAHDAAAMLLADGDAPTALGLLAAAAPSGGNFARDYAALLLVEGGLDEQIARLRDEIAHAPSPPSSMLLAYLLRAKGDLDGASKAAEGAADAELTEHLLIERRQWKELAARVQARVAQSDSIDDLGFLTAYYRLAGDAVGFEKSVTALSDFADRNPDQNWYVAEALFLNDQPDRGEAVLLKHHNYLAVADFLEPRFQFDQALSLPKLAAAEKPENVMRLKALTASTLRFLGNMPAAREVLDTVAGENRGVDDFGVWVTLTGAAREVGDRKRADGFCAEGLSAAAPNDSIPWLLEKAGFGDGSTAGRWWRFLRQQYPDETPLEALHRLHAISDGTLAGDELEAICRRAEDAASHLRPGEREQWLDAIADTLSAAGHRDSSQRLLKEIAEAAPSVHVLLRLGDSESDAGMWPQAASSYGQAWEMDRTRPLSLFLRGWALTKAGRENEGKPLMEMAHVISLGSDGPRHELHDALTKRGLDADAARERTLITRVGDFMTWERSDAMRQGGDDANGKEDYLTAADDWESAFLNNLSRNTGFLDPWANAMMPALIHKTRALGLIRTGKLEAGLHEADAAMADTPGDADAVIDVTNELQKSGHPKEADAFFGRYTGVYAKLIEEHPNSGALENELAWAQAKTGRNLAEAVKHAEHAVALEPENTASIDTLAEAYFQNGQIQKAIDAMAKCIELEPKDPHHRKQMDRFKAALKR